MEPQRYNSYTQNPDKPNKWGKRQVLILLAVIAAIAALFLSYNTYQNSSFRVSGTEPNMGDVTDITPYIHVNFNRKLTNKDIKVSGNTVKNWGLIDKTLEINLQNLKVGNTYTITVDSITSDKGEKITGKKFTFKVKEGTFDTLTEDQKNTVISRQDRFEYSPETLNIDGDGELVDYGVSDGHMHSFWQALYNYSKSVNKEFDLIRIYKASIQPIPYDDTKDYSSVQFTIEFDDENSQSTYLAQLDGYGDLSTIKLTLFDQATNAVVYDSGLVNKETIQ